jgi:diguanylate cyclase (GGDEF)-like protein/putative nucleotidyltransferase with HDIG domain
MKPAAAAASGAQAGARRRQPNDGAACARLGRVVDELGPMAVIGGTAAAVRSAAASETATTSDLVALIERDEAFAANLLRVGNAAALGRPFPTRSVRDAVVFVGRLALGRLASEVATYQFLETFPGAGRQSRGQLHIHSLAVAGCAAACAQAAGADVETVHLAALLHDIGKLVLPLAVGEQEAAQIALAHPVGRARAVAEREAFGADHAQAGALLAERSAASAEVVEAIAYHHGGHGEPVAPSVEAACIQAANAIVMTPAGDADHEVLRAALDLLDLPESALDELAHGALPDSGTATGRTLAGRAVELERLARTDDLTGLASRRAFLRHVAQQVADGERGCLLIVDVDHFKPLNDRLGHLAGDRALIEVAHLLGRHAHAGRLGGDEFALWNPGPIERARDLAGVICAEARRLTAPDVEATALSVSIGIAAAPSHGTTTSQLLAAADAALYDAKAGGRARFACARG